MRTELIVFSVACILILASFTTWVVVSYRREKLKKKNFYDLHGKTKAYIEYQYQGRFFKSESFFCNYYFNMSAGDEARDAMFGVVSKGFVVLNNELVSINKLDKIQVVEETI